MVDVAAEGAFSLELYHLEQSILDCTWWRALVAHPRAQYADVKAAALALQLSGDLDDGRSEAALKTVYENVWPEQFPEAEGSAPPRIVIRHMSENDCRTMGIASYQSVGVLQMLIEWRVPDCYSAAPGSQNSVRHFENILGQMLAELRERQFSSEGGRLCITRTSIVTPGLVDANEEYGCWLRTATVLIHHQGE